MTESNFIYESNRIMWNIIICGRTIYTPEFGLSIHIHSLGLATYKAPRLILSKKNIIVIYSLIKSYNGFLSTTPSDTFYGRQCVYGCCGKRKALIQSLFWSFISYCKLTEGTNWWWSKCSRFLNVSNLFIPSIFHN